MQNTNIKNSEDAVKYVIGFPYSLLKERDGLEAYFTRLKDTTPDYFFNVVDMSGVENITHDGLRKYKKKVLLKKYYGFFLAELERVVVLDTRKKKRLYNEILSQLKILYDAAREEVS